MGGHEIDRLRSRHLGGDHKVALVLAILVIDEDEHAAIAGIFDDLLDGSRLRRHRIRSRSALRGTVGALVAQGAAHYQTEHSQNKRPARRVRFKKRSAMAHSTFQAIFQENIPGGALVRARGAAPSEPDRRNPDNRKCQAARPNSSAAASKNAPRVSFRLHHQLMFRTGNLGQDCSPRVHEAICSADRAPHRQCAHCRRPRSGRAGLGRRHSREVAATR